MAARNANFAFGVDPTKGAAGKYVLNQKTAKFADRRTKRDRDRSTKNRNAINRSRDGF